MPQFFKQENFIFKLEPGLNVFSWKYLVYRLNSAQSSSQFVHRKVHLSVSALTKNSANFIEIYRRLRGDLVSFESHFYFPFVLPDFSWPWRFLFRLSLILCEFFKLSLDVGNVIQHYLITQEQFVDRNCFTLVSVVGEKISALNPDLWQINSRFWFWFCSVFNKLQSQPFKAVIFSQIFC